MTSTRPASVLSGSRSENESESTLGLTIRVGTQQVGLNTYHTYYQTLGSAERWLAAEQLYLGITLMGQSVSDVLLVYSPMEDRHIANPESSDSALPQVSGGTVFYGDFPDLEAALDELESIVEVAKADDCLEPTPLAIENAGLLVKTLYDISPRRYDIYPMSEGEIVIDGGNRGRRIGVFCYPDGRVLYVGWVDEIRQKVSEHGVAHVPHEFLKKVLSQLDALEQHEQQSL